jgi:hypothetical protein
MVTQSGSLAYTWRVVDGHVVTNTLIRIRSRPFIMTMSSSISAPHRPVCAAGRPCAHQNLCSAESAPACRVFAEFLVLKVNHSVEWLLSAYSFSIADARAVRLDTCKEYGTPEEGTFHKAAVDECRCIYKPAEQQTAFADKTT